QSARRLAPTLSLACLSLLRWKYPAHAANGADLDVCERQRCYLRKPLHRQHYQCGSRRRHRCPDGAEDRLSLERQGCDDRQSREIKRILCVGSRTQSRDQRAIQTCAQGQRLEIARRKWKSDDSQNRKWLRRHYSRLEKG